MATITGLTDWTAKAQVDAKLIDTDVDKVRRVLDGDTGYGLESSNLNCSSTGNKFSLSQQAEPCSRLLITVPFQNMTFSAADAGTIMREFFAVPVQARLSRVAIGWRSIYADLGTYLKCSAKCAGFDIKLGAQPKTSAGSVVFLGAENDMVWTEIPGRPIIYRGQAVPVEFTIESFDGTGAVIIYLNELHFVIELNAGFVK